MRLSDIIEHISRIFEKKRKNPVQLDNDSNLESNLKFLKVDKENTPIQISDDTVNVQGSLTVNGASPATITALNSATANELVTVGSTTTELDAEANLTFDGNHLVIKNDVLVLPQLTCQTDDDTKYIKINTIALGTTIHTSQDLTLEVDGDCINFSDGTNSFGEINIGTGSTLKLLGASNYDVNIVSTGTGDVNLVSNDDITLDSVDTIHLDSGDGTFTMKNSGTEFSAANSAYAGMILGYTCVGADVAVTQYILTTSYVCFVDSGATAIEVQFITPPSEKVEIEVELYFSAGSGASDLRLSLSDNATYGSNTLSHPNQFEKIVATPARGNGGTFTQKWFIGSGNLAAIGSNNRIWIAASTDSTSGTPVIRWGGDATNEYTNLVLKATALPLAIAVGS